MLPNKRKFNNKTFFRFWPFLSERQPKLTKNEENWQNLNWFINFSEICYLDAPKQNENAKKNYFSILAFLCLFWPKNSRNWQKIKKIGKIPSVGRFFWNVVCRCFPAKENASKNYFSISAFFGQKTAKIDQKWRKLGKSKLFDIFFKFGM